MAKEENGWAHPPPRPQPPTTNEKKENIDRDKKEKKKMPGDAVNWKEVFGVSEVKKSWDLGKCLVAEAVGVFFINYFGCMSCVNLKPPDFGANPLLIALTFGFVVMVAVQALGHVSGAHLNPAITVATVVANKVSVLRGFFYIIAQCLGAIAGSAYLQSVTPEEFRGSLGLTGVNENLTVNQAIGVEFMLGFLLVLVVFGVTDPNKPDSKIPASLAIGLAVAVGHTASVPYTGASMNPARSFGSAVIANIWNNHWVYWLGPCLGGVGAALLYTFLLAAPHSVTHYSPVQMKRLDGKEDEHP